MSFKKITLLIGLLILSYTQVISQNGNLKSKSKKFRTTNKTSIQGEVGYLTVLENRSNPKSREIKIKYIRLKSLSKTPKEPIVFFRRWR